MLTPCYMADIKAGPLSGGRPTIPPFRLWQSGGRKYFTPAVFRVRGRPAANRIPGAPPADATRPVSECSLGMVRKVAGGRWSGAGLAVFGDDVRRGQRRPAATQAAAGIGIGHADADTGVEILSFVHGVSSHERREIRLCRRPFPDAAGRRRRGYGSGWHRRRQPSRRFRRDCANSRDTGRSTRRYGRA